MFRHKKNGKFKLANFIEAFDGGMRKSAASTIPEIEKRGVKNRTTIKLNCESKRRKRRRKAE